MKKRVIITLCCIFLIVILYLTYDFHRPRHVEVSLRSTIYSVETEFEKQTQISIIGEHYKVLFGKDRFIGKMIVDNDLVYDIKLKREGNKYFETLTKNNEFHVLNSIGSIMTSADFNKVWLQLNDINERYHLTEGYVSGPAGNKNEANQVARNILEGM
ncbi:hypothetical protein U9M73_12910 [Paenibacillus phoenicis]|uniref:DUF4367 domain-containing protein n=1 Tax=Paenibacillus phoenicis TaxID=554117 RepID=A0ABU5PLR9_9BACL|nr:MULTISPECIES: hypothetical protein [Paenibacillus]MCT2194712.1 hypothetical protein [Paenibacillus sp. p3-SID1389]MEA3570886.1 hypothetical protein [Paenibacillus phoenicis]